MIHAEISLGMLCEMDGSRISDLGSRISDLRKQRHVIESPLRRKMDLHFILASIEQRRNVRIVGFHVSESPLRRNTDNVYITLPSFQSLIH